MKKILFSTLAIALLMLMSSGLALAKKAPPPFLYAFADTDGDGVYTPGKDLPAVVNEYDGADGHWIEITIPDSLVDYTKNPNGETSAVLVFPSRTTISAGKGDLYIWTPGSVKIGAAVGMHGVNINIAAKGLTVGEGTRFIAAASGYITLDIGGSFNLDHATLHASQVMIYAGVDYGDGKTGAFSAKGVSMQIQALSLGTKEGISLTDSVLHFKKSNSTYWDPQAFITTNFDAWGNNGLPYPVDFSNTTCIGPGKDYYFMSVYGSPVKGCAKVQDGMCVEESDGMNFKGNYTFYVSP